MTDPTSDLEARLRASAERFEAHVDREAIAAAAAREGLLDVAWCRVDSPVGPLVVAGTAQGLLVVSYGDPGDALEPVARSVSPRIVEHRAPLDGALRQLDEYFTGKRRRFDLALDRRLSRGFRSEVLRQLEQVEFGEVVSYRDLAERAGHAKASRAVGSAMATNPLPIVVPCHRVLRSGGALGGYAGGLEAKRWLLAHEGAPILPV
ncbi:MAG: methylated-DNA--[protein]-cysteine S-methyltransferase [Acidimicrobiales bacterium]